MSKDDKLVASLKQKLQSAGVTIEPYGKDKLYCYVVTDTSLFATTAGIILNTKTGDYEEADNHVSWLGSFGDEAIKAVKDFQQVVKDN